MKKIGLTGGIGSGKSMAASVLIHLGYPVYISDREASRLMETDPEIRSGLIGNFGSGIYTADGRLDRMRLAGIIFHDRTMLQKTNAIVHPRVMEDFGQWAGRQESPLVFFESAILYEARLDRYFQNIICVTASEDTRIGRVMKRDGATADQARARLRNQMEEDRKCRLADFVIHNDSNSMMLPQILDLLVRLEAADHQQ